MGERCFNCGSKILLPTYWWRDGRNISWIYLNTYTWISKELAINRKTRSGLHDFLICKLQGFFLRVYHSHLCFSQEREQDEHHYLKNKQCFTPYNFFILVLVLISWFLPVQCSNVCYQYVVGMQGQR